jgi:CDP-paratose 2-epimerase
MYESVIENIEKTSGEIFNVGGGPANQRNLLEVIGQIGQITNTKPDYSFADWREGDQTYYVSDIEKANQLLGWVPRVDFDAGLNDLIAWAGTVASR